MEKEERNEKNHSLYNFSELMRYHKKFEKYTET